MDAEQLLRGTPYLIDSDETALARFEYLRERASSAREVALRENGRIRLEAADLLGPYLRAIRADLVAESNVIEGYEWTSEQARQAVLESTEILSGPTRTLVESVRSDAKVYEVIGLFKAHQIAEAWAETDKSPTAAEIRELHRIIVGDLEFGGRYKRMNNAIGGSEHKPAESWDVERVMLELADWWRDGPRDRDPILAATVVHAWLAHIHPFDDGNGRLARVLANLELARAGYPPLIVRAESDRGEYYRALALSDDGDILPLYDLFVSLIRRQVKLMVKPGFLTQLIQAKFLSTERKRHSFWGASLDDFQHELEAEANRLGLEFSIHGRPTVESFELLAHREPEGNGWFATIGRPGQKPEWLLWFGYQSDILADLLSTGELAHTFPSIYISRRDRSVGALHPFSRDYENNGLKLPDELTIVPGEKSPILLRAQYDLDSCDSRKASRVLLAELAEVC